MDDLHSYVAVFTRKYQIHIASELSGITPWSQTSTLNIAFWPKFQIQDTFWHIALPMRQAYQFSTLVLSIWLSRLICEVVKQSKFCSHTCIGHVPLFHSGRPRDADFRIRPWPAHRPLWLTSSYNLITSTNCHCATVYMQIRSLSEQSKCACLPYN